MAIHVGAGVRDSSEVRDLSFDGQRRLVPAIVNIFWREFDDLKIADRRIECKRTVGSGFLSDERWRDGPIVVEVNFERCAAAHNVGVVVVVFDQGGVVNFECHLVG